MKEAVKKSKSAVENENFYVGSSVLSSSASYLIMTGPVLRLQVYSPSKTSLPSYSSPRSDIRVNYQSGSEEIVRGLEVAMASLRRTSRQRYSVP